MAKTQTNSASLDLLLEIRGRRRAGLADALREAVRSGRLAPGTRLPASRALAADLGIARSTVTECYAELVAEGWLVARQGSGTVVAPRAEPHAARPVPAVPPVHGLTPGSMEFAEFPRAQWLASARRALGAAPYSAFGYGDPAGSPELRVALADYLSRVRGVRAGPERIVICSGFHNGLGLVARALQARGVRAVGVESYSLGLYRALLADLGLGIPALAVDGFGAIVGEVEAGAVLLTPAHQFPTGVALSPERRLAALEWARDSGGYILEDDYDGEFRYDRKPVGALQGLDPERVVYFGTASKSLAPALRVGWMALPEDLVADVLAAKGRVELVSVLDQLTLADFIASGRFDRHLRARRQTYRRRRDELIAALAVAAPAVRVTGMAAGLQAVLELPAGTERATVEEAARQGLMVSGLAEYRHGEPEQRDALVVNYSTVSDAAWDRALGVLCAALASGRPQNAGSAGPVA